GPMLFCSEVFHCCTYCDGECGSNAVKLTVVAGSAPVPRTGVPKLNPVLNKATGGVKLSACCVSGKTYGTLWRWLHQVFMSTGVKKTPYEVCKTNPKRGKFLARPSRGAKLCLFEKSSPSGYPDWPPMKTDGVPFEKMRFEFVLCVS